MIFPLKMAASFYIYTIYTRGIYLEMRVRPIAITFWHGSYYRFVGAENCNFFLFW